MFLGLSRSIYDIEWVPGGPTYGQVRHQEEQEMSRYYFELADVGFLQAQLDGWEREAKRCLEAGLVLPAYEGALKCSHLFNVLDARGAVSVTERVALMKRVRDLAVGCAQEYVASRERLGFPLLRSPSPGAGGGPWLSRRPPTGVCRRARGGAHGRAAARGALRGDPGAHARGGEPRAGHPRLRGADGARRRAARGGDGLHAAAPRAGAQGDAGPRRRTSRSWSPDRR